MKRGDIYEARLEPVEGSEQGGTRPVIIVSRDVINTYSPVILAVLCTTYQLERQVYPTQMRVLSKSRLLRLRGNLSPEAIVQLNQALLVALDLPEQASYS